MSKEKLMAKEELKALAQRNDWLEQTAKLVGDVYDVEIPINELISEIFETESVEVGEDFDYLAPETVAKEVFVIASDCTITQVKVTPSTENELTLVDLFSPEYYVCITDLLKGKHNILNLKAEAIEEAMDRQEIYTVLQLVDAGAVAESNVFELDALDGTFDFPKLQEMKKSIRKYGKKLVLITGSNVTDDVDLMDYNSDKNREHSIFRLVDKWIPVEDFSVDIDGTPTAVIGSDVAYLVAVSDSKLRKPGYFVRRKMDIIAPDLTVVAKERAIIASGASNPVGAVKKASKGLMGLQEYGAVLVNPKTCARFTKVYTP